MYLQFMRDYMLADAGALTKTCHVLMAIQIGNQSFQRTRKKGLITKTKTRLIDQNTGR